jgi:hypothetical protein
VTIPGRCPLPGCENPAGTGKTGACSGGHATKIASAARRMSAAMTAASKRWQRGEEQRRGERRAQLEQALHDREASVLAAYWARRRS